MSKPYVDQFLEDCFPPERCAALQAIQSAVQNLAELELPITDEQRERAAKLARERGWKGPMPWEPGYVKGSQAKL